LPLTQVADAPKRLPVSRGTMVMHTRLLIPVLLSAVLPASALAHPSVSVVMDSRGIVYYSDLANVWMIAPDGSRQIAVPNVHTHELWLDADDRLYGEDVTNRGDVYWNRVWVRSPDGTIADVIPRRPGHPTEVADYSFVRDDRGRTFVLRRAERRIDVRRDGRVVRVIPLDDTEGFIHWMTLNDTGDCFVGVGAGVYRIPRGGTAPVRIAAGLVESTPAFSFVHARHAMMGMWTDTKGNVFVAVYAGQVVKRIAPEGDVSVVYRSGGEWSPSGGLIAPGGSLWILETSSSNRVRVSKIES
jgi:hypothetical protein